jgi:hypothetical protein
VKVQAYCRYGPAKAYLPADDLYPGDTALVHNRNRDASWLWILVNKDGRHCWASASVLDVVGDVRQLVEYYHPLPQSTLYDAPDDVVAVRDGDDVTISWDRVDMTKDDDRGYLLDLRVCQDGNLISVLAQTDDDSYTVEDEDGCEGESKGKLYAVEKHGYTDAVKIPWPEREQAK